MKNPILTIPKKYNGVWEHSFSLAKELNKKHEVLLFTNWFDGEPKLIDLDCFKEKPISISEFERIVNNEYSILHLQTHTYEYNGLLPEIEQKKCKILYTLHGVIPYYYMPSNKKEMLLEGKLSKEEISCYLEKLNEREKFQIAAVKKADAIITLCEAHKKAVQELYGYKGPIFVLENVTDFASPVFLRYIESKRNKISKDNEKLQIIYYRQPINLRKMLKAFNKIRKKYDAKLIILKGKNKQELLDCGLEEDLLDDIDIVSWKDKTKVKEFDELIEIYLKSDVMIQPIVTPGLFPKVVLDAMVFKIPVISCKSSYTVGSSKNVDEICKALDYLIENKHQVNSIVERAFNKVITQNSWEFYIMQLERIISNI